MTAKSRDELRAALNATVRRAEFLAMLNPWVHALDMADFTAKLDILISDARERVLSLLLAEGVINELIADHVREGLLP